MNQNKEKITLTQLLDKDKNKQKYLADALRMTPVTFSAKKKAPGKFFVTEVMELAHLLKLSPEELLRAMINQIETNPVESQ